MIHRLAIGLILVCVANGEALACLGRADLAHELHYWPGGGVALATVWVPARADGSAHSHGEPETVGRL